MAVFTITFTVPGQDGEQSFQCDENTWLLDAAEAAGFDWPYQERSGNDSTSVARLTSGQVDQSQQTFLVEEQIAAGLIVTAVAWPQSDCALVIDQGEEL
ncbi:hypothetical protein N7489_007089 [Penicillium chrysogenum]|jgi:ferredoxin|uniref:uncharacterized protein n=1 Tax=Penicillium chrysogenum TaxID=5076 RepID=UPI0023913096|nr:uncharacterized protein N7489_007089 [Penicillium chrysogenum]KAJ5236998.1 hypothetical protein N7489_007089 [Penicillium chrysogenum]KAJ5276961.1 hypothetical protein N7524_003114 [Penicillium chrysogenum]KAJ6152298.1 hypothetical protein N7497_006617 [Penicillium chrysogenum]